MILFSIFYTQNFKFHTYGSFLLYNFLDVQFYSADIIFLVEREIFFHAFLVPFSLKIFLLC